MTCVLKINKLPTPTRLMQHPLLQILRRTIFFFLLSLSAFAQTEVPELWGHRVHDEAKVLSQNTIDNLERTLQLFEDSTSNQIAVLTITSLNGEAIDQFGIRVVEKWKLGKSDKDNGILLLVAVDDRKMRIEVGQGLEGSLPDAICARIIRNEMAPAFRRGDYDTGVVAAIDAIRLAIKGEYTGSGPISRRGGRGGTFPGFMIFIVLLILIMRSRGGRGGGGAGWFIAGSLLGRGMGGGGGGSSWSGGGGSFGGGGSSGSW